MYRPTACRSLHSSRFMLGHSRALLLHGINHCQHARRAVWGTAAAAAAEGDAASAGAGNPASKSKQEGKPLDAYIGPGLQLMEQDFSVDGRLLRMIAPIDVDAVMDMYIEKGIDGDPYWCRVWPSAISLAQQLLQRPELVAGKKVADLGAGLGVAGLAAALAGAREVVLLDREPLALQCGLISAAASGVIGVEGLDDVQLQPSGTATSSSSNSSSSNATEGDAAQQAAAGTVPAPQQAAPAELLQLTQLYLQHRLHQQQQQHVPQQQPSSPLQVSSSSSSSSSSSAAQLQQQQSSAIYRACPFDWSSSKAPGRFDVVLACDVLYEDTAVEPVAAVVSKLLKPGSGTLLLADPPNRTAANRQRFVELLSSVKPSGLLLEEAGVYQCDVHQLDPEMTGGVTTQTVPVQFMAFRAAVGNDTVGLKLS